MTSTSRIPKAELNGPMGTMIKAFSKRQFGEVPDALGVVWNNQRVLRTMMALSRKAEKWSEVDQGLKTLAHMAVAAVVGCSWCLDFGYFTAHNEGADEAKVREVARWRESDVFTPLERDVMAYAEAVTQTPPTVTDELSARLLDQLGAPALVELTAFISMANFVTRNNVAWGVRSQEFSAACGLPPLPERSDVVGSSA